MLGTSSAPESASLPSLLVYAGILKVLLSKPRLVHWLPKDWKRIWANSCLYSSKSSSIKSLMYPAATEPNAAPSTMPTPSRNRPPTPAEVVTIAVLRTLPNVCFIVTAAV